MHGCNPSPKSRLLRTSGARLHSYTLAGAPRGRARPRVPRPGGQASSGGGSNGIPAARGPRARGGYKPITHRAAPRAALAARPPAAAAAAGAPAAPARAPAGAGGRGGRRPVAAVPVGGRPRGRALQRAPVRKKRRRARQRARGRLRGGAPGMQEGARRSGGGEKRGLPAGGAPDQIKNA